MESKRRENQDKGFAYYIKEWILPIVVAFIIATLINKFWFFNIKVPTESMYPAIVPGDRILVTRIYKKENLNRGDIIVFHSDELGEDLIKRLIGLPGDKVQVKKDGSLYINGEKREESYVVNQGEKEKEFVVPKDSFLFMGDNRANSLDSRYWKNPYISKEKIMGKAQFIITPFKRTGKLK
ncbi:signal peptidase I [Hathewaya massiliensis]|uniref:signal peptidase I n=1 Tax=Hathewaya massiliensis TaxID=1964382 RepID=UPI00115BEEA3|nr:signal peptidase I [Hathewaya massiliensis]